MARPGLSLNRAPLVNIYISLKSQRYKYGWSDLRMSVHIPSLIGPFSFPSPFIGAWLPPDTSGSTPSKPEMPHQLSSFPIRRTPVAPAVSDPDRLRLYHIKISTLDVASPHRCPHTHWKKILFGWKEGGPSVLMLSSTSCPSKKGKPGKSLKNTIHRFCPCPPHPRPRKPLQSEKIFFLSVLIITALQR